MLHFLKNNSIKEMAGNSIDNKDKILYNKCCCYDTRNCAPYNRFKIDKMFNGNELNDDVDKHLVNLKVIILIIFILIQVYSNSDKTLLGLGHKVFFWGGGG